MCDGYETPDGVCVTPTLPINTFTPEPGIVEPVGPITELPNTGEGIDLVFSAVVILLVGVVMFALSKFLERGR